jgi:hypothetical protein
MRYSKHSRELTPLSPHSGYLWHVTCTLQGNGKFQTTAQIFE